MQWIGFEGTTPLRLAHELASARLAARGLAVIDEFDEVTLMEAAMDRVLEAAGGRLAGLAESSGLRRAMVASVRSLRLAGMDAAHVRATRLRDAGKRDQVAAILADYEAALATAGLVDAAGVLAAALEAEWPLPGRVLVLQDGPARGLPRAFLDRLVAAGAELLPMGAVHGLHRPDAWLPAGRAAQEPGAPSALGWLHAAGAWTAAAKESVTGADPGGAGGPQQDVVLDVFSAASVAVELREVLRRVVAAGLRWDEVEIIATDVDAYGVALDGLARRLGIPVGHARGLRLPRTRVGRAVGKYLEWVRAGFPADGLRRMLERGDLAVPGAGSSSAALARQLARLGTAPGPAGLAAAAAAADGREDAAALAVLLRRVLAAAPRPAGDGRVSAGALAAGALDVLPLVPAHDAVERAARARIAERLRRLQATATRPLAPAAAVAAVLSRLDDRVPAPEGEAGSPWVAAGGHLHLSDLETGGWSGRAATFIVGLDSGRFPGAGGTDALLVDDDRRRLNGAASPAPLALSTERTEERRYAFAALAARLRGRVTFSYAAWDAVEGRELAPAAELLQVHRLMCDDASADYEALYAAVRPPVSAVPRGTVLLDGADAWLHALSGGAAVPGALRRGVEAVCQAWPGLASGVRAYRSRLRGTEAGAAHGIISPRPQLDPRNDAGARVSATRLETLGTCPHRYLLKYVLGVRVPEDAAPAPGTWLRPHERGRLLHDVFERALAAVMAGDVALEGDAFDTVAAGILDEAIAARCLDLPPPGDPVLEAERAGLRDDVAAFTAMVREDGRRFLALEHAFGRDGADPVPLDLPDGSTIRLAGSIDRVDELPDGSLLVVDYKTGRPDGFAPRTGVLHGGRRLQHVLYAAVAERLFGRVVAGAEYQFPTRRSENHRVRYTAGAMAGGMARVAALLDLVRNGWFLPTSAADDCLYCDYRDVCRVEVDRFGRAGSRLVEWAGSAAGPAAEHLRAVRR